MKTKPGLNSALIMVVSSLMVLAPATSQAVDVELSGQVNRLFMFVDNGVEDGIVHADNSVSGTRWRLKSSGDVGNGMKAGLYYETQLQSNPSSSVTEGSLDSDGEGGDVGKGDYFSLRQANIWIKGDFGKITLGQGDGAANGSTEADKSGTDVIQYPDSSRDVLGSMEYGSSGVIVGEARSSFDGLSRNDNIRYDGGNGPFGFAVSMGNGDKTEVGVKYKTKSLVIRAALWDEVDSGAGVTGNAISASWDSGKGFNLTGAFSGDNSGNDPTNIYLKAGYKMGNSAYGVDFSETTDKAAGDGSSISFAWVNNVTKGVQAYVSYRVESLDHVAGADDITALVAGARVKF